MKINEVHYSLHRKQIGRAVKTRYFSEMDMSYYSPRYKKTKTFKKHRWSDGATGVIDLASFGWWIHDAICEDWTWDDGTPISVLQSSMVLHDIMREEGRGKRANVWGTGTFVWQILKRPFRRKK